jgi:hypothetical protein
MPTNDLQLKFTGLAMPTRTFGNALQLTFVSPVVETRKVANLQFWGAAAKPAPTSRLSYQIMQT